MLTELNSQEEIQHIKQTADTNKVPYFIIKTSPPHDKNAFFEAVIKALPLDPPMMMANGRAVWDALSDSIFGGLDELGSKKLIVIWEEHSLMQDAFPEDYSTAVDILKHVQNTLSSAESTDNNPQQLDIFLA